MSRCRGAESGLNTPIPSQHSNIRASGAHLNPSIPMKHRELASLESRLTEKLEGGKSLEPDDLLDVRRLMHAVNKRYLTGVLIWLAVCVVPLVTLELMEIRSGYHDVSANSIAISIWILSIGIVRFLPDHGLAKILAKLQCSQCGRRIGTRHGLDQVIEERRCPRCGVAFPAEGHASARSDPGQ